MLDEANDIEEQAPTPISSEQSQVSDEVSEEETIENPTQNQDTTPPSANGQSEETGEEESEEKDNNFSTTAEKIKNNLSAGRDIYNNYFGHDDKFIDITEPFVPGACENYWIEQLQGSLDEYIGHLRQEHLLFIESDSSYLLSEIQNNLGETFKKEGYSLEVISLTQHQASKLKSPLNFHYLYDLVLERKSRKSEKDRILFVEGSQAFGDGSFALRFLQSLLMKYHQYERKRSLFKNSNIYIVYLSSQSLIRDKIGNNEDWNGRNWFISSPSLLLKNKYSDEPEKAENLWEELESLRKLGKWQNDQSFADDVRQSVDEDTLEALIEEKKQADPIQSFDEIEDEQQKVLLNGEFKTLIRYTVFITTFFPDLSVSNFREVMEILLLPKHHDWQKRNEDQKDFNERSLMQVWQENDDDIMYEAQVKISRGRLGHSTVQFIRSSWRSTFENYYHSRYANFIQRQLISLLNSNIIQGAVRKVEIKRGIIELAAQLAVHDVENYGLQIIWDWVFQASEELIHTQQLQNELQAYRSAKRNYGNWRDGIRRKAIEEAVQYIQKGMENLEKGYEIEFDFKGLEEIINVDGQQVSISKEKLIDIISAKIAELENDIQVKEKAFNEQSGSYSRVVRGIADLLIRFSDDPYLKESVVKPLLKELSNRPKFHPLLANFIAGISLEGNHDSFGYFKLLMDKKRGTAEITFDLLRSVIKYSPSQLYELLEKVKEWQPEYRIPKVKIHSHQAYSLMLLPAYFLEKNGHLEVEWPPKHPLLVPLELTGNDRIKLIEFLMEWLFHPALPAAYLQFGSEQNESDLNQVNQEVGLLRAMFFERMLRLLEGNKPGEASDDGTSLMNEFIRIAKEKGTPNQLKRMNRALSMRIKQQNHNILSVKAQDNDHFDKRAKIEEMKVQRKAIRDLRERIRK